MTLARVSTRGRRGQRGSAMLEFTLVGIPLIFLMTSTFEIARAMWSYHTLASSMAEATRYASVRGKNCACLTIDGIARKVAAYDIGLATSQLNVSLISSSATTSCNPVTSCYGNTGTWPPTADAAPGSTIQIKAIYAFVTPLALFWPGQSAAAVRAVNLGASSAQAVQY